MARKPYTWSRKPTAGRRTYRTLADEAKLRAKVLADRAAQKARAKLLGHKLRCPICGKTARTPGQVATCQARHKQDRERARSRQKTTPARPARPSRNRDTTGSGWGKPGTRRRGTHSCAGCGKTFTNDLDFRNHGRQHQEREDRAKRREQERARRQQATEDRTRRGGKPAGTPKTRPPKTRDPNKRTTKLRTPEERSKWHSQQMQMAGGRMDRAGNRLPHPPSPGKVRPRTPVDPATRAPRPASARPRRPAA